MLRILANEPIWGFWGKIPFITMVHNTTTFFYDKLPEILYKWPSYILEFKKQDSKDFDNIGNLPIWNDNFFGTRSQF
jgi:hypothetical protein